VRDHPGSRGDVGVTLLCFPPYDRAFMTLANRRLAALATRSPEHLQAALRAAYPGATVRPRHRLAAFLPDTVWYVYRDGRYSPYAVDDRWWEGDDVARLVVGPDGRYIEANQAALNLLGVSLDALVEMQTGDLVDPAVAELVPWTWDVVRETGELHATSILRAAGARPRMGIEYRLVLEEQGGPAIAYLRPIPIAAAEPSPDEPFVATASPSG
jgi:PAS domain-containing protein